MPPRPSLSSIAAEAGMSKGAVSNILAGRNKGNWTGTRARADKVHAIAKRLGWRPNAASKAVSTGRFDALGLVWRDRDYLGSLPGGLLDGICDAISKHDLHLIIARMGDQLLEGSERLPKVLRELSTDGLLLSCIEAIPAETQAVIRRHRIPAIWLNAKLESDCVFPDDHGAGAEVARRLLGLGHRRIAYVQTGESQHYSADDRRAGVLSAFAEAGIQPIIDRVNIPDAERPIWARSLLSRPDRPTAVITYSCEDLRQMAFAAFACGLAIPHDLSLATFEDRPALIDGRPISHVRTPFRELGAAGIECLIERIAHPRIPLAALALPCPWQDGSTCAPPRFGVSA